jgi:hypothetical protein
MRPPPAARSDPCARRVPLALRPLVMHPGVVPDGVCSHVSLGLLGAAGAQLAAFGAPPYAPSCAAAELPGGAVCCACLVQAAAVFLCSLAVVAPFLLAARWELRAKSAWWRTRHGRPLRLVVPLVTPAWAWLLGWREGSGAPASALDSDDAGGHAPLAAAAALLPALWFVSEAVVSLTQRDCASACVVPPP